MRQIQVQVPLTRQQREDQYIMREGVVNTTNGWRAKEGESYSLPARSKMLVCNVRCTWPLYWLLFVLQVLLSRPQLEYLHVMREVVNTTKGVQAEEGKSKTLEDVNM